MELSKNYFQNAVEIFKKFSLQQKLLVGGIAGGAVILLFLIIFVFNEQEYATLYANMNEEDASAVVSALNQRDVPYQLEDGGKTVLVPADEVYDLRLQLASDGVPSSGVIGYEIFDEQSIGTSEAMQDINYRRAIEGELSKTLMTMKEIETARVHIVIPKRALFKDEQKEPTASVNLKLKKNTELSEGNINAISRLVASSIEGLQPENVTIVAGGQLLSKEKETEMEVFTDKQYELKQSVEKYLSNKAQEMLDRALGYDNSIIKVNVDLDFKQIDSTMENFYPESQIEVSEQTIESKHQGNTLRSQIDSDTFSDTTNIINKNTTTNYEISKTVARVIEGPGNIKRISAAAFVNYKWIWEERTEEEVTKKVRLPVPRTDEELEQIRKIISQAIGIGINQEDLVSVENIRFDDTMEEVVEESAPTDFLQEWGNTLLMIVAIIVALFVLKNLLGKLKEEKMLAGEIEEEEEKPFGDELAPIDIEDGLELEESEPSEKPLIEIGDIKKEISDDAIKRQVRQERIANYVAKNPGEAAKLINIWLKEDEG